MTDAARRAPTMRDVAEVAGVSHQTVSRVLNAEGYVRPETRDRVVAAITELGYRRNLAARTLVSGRTRAIGVLAPAVPQYGATSTLLAVESATRERGYHPLVTAAAIDAEASRSALEFLLDQSIEALVVIAPHARMVEAIGALDIGIPVVTLQAPTSTVTDSVGVDQSEGMRLATEHLIALGHRRIQHLAGPDGYFEAAARRRGFDGAIAAAGLEPLPVLTADWTARSGFAAAAVLAPGVTAVACANDQSAFGLIAALTDAGLRIPDDVAVTGFDDVPEAEFQRPALTTVRQDFDLVGRRAVERVVARLDGIEPVVGSVIAPELVVRASTVAPG